MRGGPMGLQIDHAEPLHNYYELEASRVVGCEGESTLSTVGM